MKDQIRSTFRYNDQNVQRYPDHIVKYACPCCPDCFDSKDELQKHIESHKITFDDERPIGDDDWHIGDANITQLFNTYKKHCIKNCSESNGIDKDFLQLLAISSIIVIQKRTAYTDGPYQHINRMIWKEMYQTMAMEIGIYKLFNTTAASTIKQILCQYRDDILCKLEARLALLFLAKSTTGPMKNVIFCLEALVHGSRDLNTTIESENELEATVIHPFMFGLLVGDDEHRNARCANTALFDDDQCKRPDYVVEKYDGYDLDYRTCIGEIKTSNTTNSLLVTDFYRVALFCKAEMERHNMDGFLCFQAIGFEVTFYFMKPKSNLLTLTEVLG
ncbi:hypothetical protein DFQ28_011188 [Apophysomyces sp. BC1034]|nr:hypothetical protein DFQ30_010939 [Apophysomyces sp. BC1015]KAG0169476.1 hypothetical protein DFQ29_009679 [Apophysomyces sp. BC1021]KAG0184414.1 hypothetical protein DFQ28_011188 [Apophysomyces sp. BC1034]